MTISESDIRELFKSVGIEATEDQISSVAFDLTTTIEEYSTVPVPMIGVSRQQYEDQSDIICELKKKHRDCSECAGTGYTLRWDETTGRCPKCDGFGVERKFR